MLLHEIIANTLVTIYSPPGVNAIGSTRVLPMAKDVPEGTTHVSDGLDGLLAGQYRTQYGKYDLTDKLIWVYVDHLSHFRAAFVYYDGMLLRKARGRALAHSAGLAGARVVQQAARAVASSQYLLSVG